MISEKGAFSSESKWFSASVSIPSTSLTEADSDSVRLSDLHQATHATHLQANGLAVGQQLSLFFGAKGESCLLAQQFQPFKASCLPFFRAAVDAFAFCDTEAFGLAAPAFVGQHTLFECTVDFVDFAISPAESVLIHVLRRLSEKLSLNHKGHKERKGFQ